MNQAPTGEGRVLEALARVPVFSQLDERDRRKLAKLCRMKRFEAGDVIYEEGSMGLGLFIVTSGRVERFRSQDGERVSFGAVAAGGVLGQLALIDDQPRATSAEALEPTECLLLTRDGFGTLLKKDPQIAWLLAPEMAVRIRELLDRSMAAELAREAPAAGGGEPAAPGGGAEPGDGEPAARSAAETDDEEEEEDDGASDVESAFFKMMRIQYGMMAGAAKCMTESSRVMEKFLDSMAEETDLKTNEDWGDLMGRIPDAMVTAAREAMDQWEKVPEEMVDAYRRYSEGDD